MTTLESPASAREGETPAEAPRGWTGRTRGGLVGNWIFAVTLRTLGLRCAYALLAPVSFYYLFFAPKAVRASWEYRRRIGYGGKGVVSRYLGAWRHFYSFGKILLDRVAIISGAADKFQVEFDGEEHMRAALSHGRGAVLITGHCGNWEAAGHMLKRLDAPVNVVAYEGEARHVRRLFAGVLKDRYFSLIVADGTARASLEISAALARGEVVAMHADRTLGSAGVTLPFLGAPARFPVGPYIVAAVTGAPLVHVFAMREGLYRYHFYAYPAERLQFASRGERDEQLARWAGRFAARLEEKLRAYPLQWHNFYSFWQEDNVA